MLLFTDAAAARFLDTSCRRRHRVRLRGWCGTGAEACGKDTAKTIARISMGNRLTTASDCRQRLPKRLASSPVNIFGVRSL